MRVVPFALSLALGTLALAAPLAAQQSTVVGGAEIDAALAAHSTAADAQRAAVQRTLDRPEVAAVANQMGIDAVAARGAVSALEGEQLGRASAASADIERALAGGAMLSIQTTTLIIVLLVIILLVIVVE